MIKTNNIFNKILSGFIAFLMVFQSVAPSIVLAQEVTTSAPLEESPAPASEPSPSPAAEGEVNPTPTPEVTPTATPQPSEILVEPSPTPSTSPESSENPIPAATLEPQLSQPQESSEPTSTPSDQTDQGSQTQDNANQANAPPSDVNPKDTVEPSVSPSPSAIPTIETIESQGQTAGQLATYILENTSASSAEEVLDIDPVNVVESASLSTDKADYAPTDTAVITGKDFPKVADLKLIITAENYRFETGVTTDENGSFVYFYQLDGTYRPLYIVEAYDLSGTLLATVTFTDSPPSLGNPAANLDQCANGPFTSPTTCTGSAWVNGNINQSKAHYREDDSAPYRFVMTGLSSGAHAITFEWDTTQSSQHAIDYLTSYNRTETTADACSQVSGCNLSTFSTFAIPDDPNSPVAQVAGNFILYGGTITAVSSYALSGSYNGNSSTSVTVNFTVSSSSAVLAIGGHIASQIDWGWGNSASGISGSPYHMRLIDLDGSGGNQDRGLAATAILVPPNLTTQVSQSSINLGQSVTDTATLSGNAGVVTGTVSFFICGPDTTNPDCTTGGTQVGSAVTIFNNQAISSSFTPQQDGNYCFRAEYTPDQSAQYSPINHTNLTSECFTVIPKGSLTVIKHVVGGTAVASDWIMHVNSSQTQDVVPAFPGAESPGTAVSLIAGTYIVSETGDSADYSLSYSGDCDFYGNVSVVVGQTKICTLTNSRDTGSVLVHKLVDTDADGIFETTDGEANVLGFRWGLDGVNSTNNMGTTVAGVPTGSHSVSENSVSDYHFVGWFNNLGQGSCTNPDGTTLPASINVSKDQTTEMTLCNRRDTSTITVNKILVPNNDPGKFDLKIDGVSYAVGIGNSGTTGQVKVLTGQHTVSEVGNNTDLSDYNVIIGGDCSSDGTVTVGKDQNKVCTITNTRLGAIIVEKQTLPDGDPQSFTFSGDAAGSISDNGQIVVGHLLPGTYTSTENLPGYWDLTEISCNDTNSSGNLGNKTATFNVSAGEVVKCTFTNTKKGHLIVQKTTLPGGDPTVFSITASGSGTITGGGAGTITDATDKDYEVTPGTYSVTEAPVSYWDESSNTCQNVVVSAGQSVTCTITNTKQGSITILKDANPDDSQDFQFTGSFGNFQLDDDSNPDSQNSKTFTNVEVGVYSVSEITVAGWDLTNTSCSDGSSVDSIQLDPGESIICTFINTKKGHLIVHKVTSPKDTTTEFIIEALGSGSVTAPVIRTIVGGESEDFEVSPGTYSVSEVVALGWDESSNTCQDVLVSAGQTVECIITNTQLGTIIVEKQTNPDGDQTGFEFEGDATGVISDNDQIVVFDLLPGIYTSAEVVPPGWDLTDISCSDNDSFGDVSNMTATFNLQAGERVKCIFTNTKRGHLIVEKVTLPGGDLTLFPILLSGSGTISGLGAGVITDALDQMYEVTPGTYSVLETVPPGWDKTQDTCQNVVVSAGQSVTCTITNTKRGEIIVEKQTLPDSSQQSFEFSPSYSSNFYLSDGQINSSGSLVPGLYSVAEFDTDGWDLTNASCSDGNNPDSIILDPGERVICTFENTQRGTISGTKYEVNADGSIVSVLSGWVISLFSGSTLIDQDITDQSGRYSFTNIVADVYTLVEDLLSDWTQIFAPAPVSLQSGQSSTNNNFGNFQNGTITGVKFNDLDGNGQDDQDPRLSGWTIFIDANQNGTLDEGETSTQTTALGYSFTNLGPGSYTVCEVEQPGWFRTKPALSNCELVTLTNSAQTITLDFGNQGRGTITVLKNVDSNGDGVIDMVGATDWTWDVNSTGNFATGSTQQVAAGTYTISEDQKANYHVVSLVCGQTNFGALESQQISVGPGENVVCTFTNAQDTGTITIVKNVDTNGDGDVLDPLDVIGATDWTYDLQNGEQNIPTGQSRTLLAGTYTISEDQKAGFELVGWSCSDGQTGTTNQIVVNIIKDSETVCTLTNKQLPAQLILEKTNNRLGVDVTAGADVSYTLTVTLSGSDLDDVSLIDLLPVGFKYRLGSWTALSSVRGDLRGLGITPEPKYASPGSWQLGDMVGGETVTITLLADIDGGVDPGLYKDLSWAKGAGVLSNEVLANEDSGIFVSTEVNVVDRSQGASYDVENKVEKKEIAQVLAVSTQLPATGADGGWTLLASALLMTGMMLFSGGVMGRRKDDE